MQHAMTEIRIRRAAIVPEPEESLRFGALWTPDSPQVRQAYASIVEAGIEVYGPGSHWIDEREA